MHAALIKSFAMATMALTMTGAFADPVVENSFFLSPTFGDGLTQIFPLADTFDLKGTTFSDTFIFNSPPATADIAFNVMSGFDFAGAEQQISFTKFLFAPFQPGEAAAPIALNSTFNSFFVAGQTLAALDVGIYELTVTGITLADSASINGVIEASATTPVPEPASWTFVLIGLAAVCIARRRRSGR